MCSILVPWVSNLAPNLAPKVGPKNSVKERAPSLDRVLGCFCAPYVPDLALVWSPDRLILASRPSSVSPPPPLPSPFSASQPQHPPPGDVAPLLCLARGPCINLGLQGGAVPGRAWS